MWTETNVFVFILGVLVAPVGTSVLVKITVFKNVKYVGYTNIEIDGTPLRFTMSLHKKIVAKVAASIKNVEVFLFVASLGDFNVISSQDPKRIKLDLALEMESYGDRGIQRKIDDSSLKNSMFARIK